MEIRKKVYVLLIGGLLCMFFAGLMKYIEGTGKKDDKAYIPTIPHMSQATNVPNEVHTKEPTKLTTQEPVEPTAEPMKPARETLEPSEEPTEHPMEFVGEPDVQVTPPPVKTASPTMAPISESPQKQEEKPNVQNTPQPISPTKAPQATHTPMPQNTEQPMATKMPPVEEEVHVHEFEKAIWELPTCQKGGYYNNVCKSCGFVECVSQEPLPHEQEDIVLQEGNCMEDKVIRHICKECGIQVQSDTRYTVYDAHQWEIEEVDGVLVEYCERCGVVK